MTQIWESDLDVLFDPQDFGVASTYTDPLGATHSITVIFDEASLDVQIGNSSFESVGPTALAKSADVPTVNNKATLLINSVTYHVVEVSPSATGVTMLKLSKDAV